MQTKQLTKTVGPLWESAMALYCKIFPEWERESIPSIEAAINSGNSRCIVVYEGDKTIGMSLTEVYLPYKFAMLAYLFIAPSHQGQGLGTLLCLELFDFFNQNADLNWLLVEAETKPEQFYNRLGFTTLEIKYQSPHYDDMHSTPMALMLYLKTGQSAPSKAQLWRLVNHIFCESYYLSSDDPRLEQQRKCIL